MSRATSIHTDDLESPTKSGERQSSSNTHSRAGYPEAWKEKVERLRRIWLGLEQYCSGKPREQARCFYFDEMFDEVVRLASERSFRERPRPEVYLLISLLGYSPETTLLTFELLKPSRLLVITPRDAEEELECLNERLIRSGKLKFSCYERQDCEGSEHTNIFRIIERRLRQGDVRQEIEKARHELSEQRHRIPVTVDITGGKKVMGAVAALAAWEFNVVPCYLDGDEYDQEMRRPVPGTERLLILDQAMSEFGGQELRAALRLFEAGAFDAAYQHFQRLAEHLTHPQRARMFRDISELYSAWCNLDMEKLQRCTDRLKQAVEAARLPLRHADSRVLRKQLEFLKSLTSQDRDSLVLNHYLLGLHYQEIGRYDFSALLFYRTIEGCFTRRLELRNLEFNPRRPDYTMLGNPDELLKSYRAWAEKVDPTFQVEALPHRISLMDAAVLLCALGDELMAQAGLDKAESLGNLRQLTEIRNRSVLAHGYQSVSKDDSEKLGKRAHHILKSYWQLAKPKEDLDERIQELRFIQRLEDQAGLL